MFTSPLNLVWGFESAFRRENRDESEYHETSFDKHSVTLVSIENPNKLISIGCLSDVAYYIGKTYNVGDTLDYYALLDKYPGTTPYNINQDSKIKNK